jgi:hypothetical protein
VQCDWLSSNKILVHILLEEKSKTMAGRFGEFNEAEIQVVLEKSV